MKTVMVDIEEVTPYLREILDMPKSKLLRMVKDSKIDDSKNSLVVEVFEQRFNPNRVKRRPSLDHWRVTNTNVVKNHKKL